MFPKGFFISVAAFIFIVIGTILAIFWARGYRPDLKNGTFNGTGLLSANSFPTGATVYVDDKLTTATDNTINLAPGDYDVKIVKDGFITWRKKLKLSEELVTQTDALLFPAATNLNALTYIGAINPVPSSDGQKIAFCVASASSTLKNGLYILDLSNRTLSFRSEIKQISNNDSFDFSKADWIWSPDSAQILAWYQDDQQNIIQSVLLESNKMNDVLLDQTVNIPTILADWQLELDLKYKERLGKLPKKLKPILTNNTTALYWSPDETKIMYTATASATITDKLIPALPASNTQSQQRNLKPGNIYLYDLKEDRNFLVTEGKLPDLVSPGPVTPKSTHDLIKDIRDQYSPIFIQNAQWYTDSKHIVISQNDKITIQEYDGTNKMTVYAGPLYQRPNDGTFVFPSPDGSKLVILANLNNDTPPNLYAVSLK